MFEQLFPQYFLSALNFTPLNKINEIRIRQGKRVVISISNKSYYLSQDGITGDKDRAIIADKFLIDDIIKRACENSVYAFSDQIKNGYITTKGGIRIGIGGEGVYEKNTLKTIKNINSLSIRIAREVKDCSKPILQYIFLREFQNTLIISPPGCGKTTMIRDVLRSLSEKNYCYNILLVDERFEIANCFNGISTLDVGNFCDVLSGIDKGYAFEYGIRSLRPDIIVTDELANKDYEALQLASSCGVRLLASIHARSIEDLRIKKGFDDILSNKIFDRFVVLSSREGVGTIEGVYDENLRCISY